MKMQLRSDTLKILAMFFMFLDHVGELIVERAYVTVTDIDLALKLYNIDLVLRGIGRLAMPIFCYQIIVGIARTRNQIRYFGTIVLFAFISEIPFDIAFGESAFDFSCQNVMFSLALGTAVILLIELFSDSLIFKNIASDKTKKVIFAVYCAIVILAMSEVAELIKCDYGAKAVILIVALYLLRNDRINMVVWGCVIFVAANFIVMYTRTPNIKSVMDYMEFESYACLAFPLMAMDNGERRGGKTLKWVGYFFYSAHILLLAGIGTIVVNSIKQ